MILVHDVVAVNRVLAVKVPESQIDLDLLSGVQE